MSKATRDYSHSLYLQRAIEETKQAYSELLEIDLNHTESGTLATFQNDGEDLDFLVDAFSNHALFLTIQQFRDGDEA